MDDVWPVPGILLAVARDPDPAAAIGALVADLPAPLVIDVIKSLAHLAVTGWTRAAEAAGVDADAVLGELQAVALEMAAG